MNYFRSLDFFPKLQGDQVQHIRKTNFGGLLFLGTFFLMIILILNELYIALVKGELEVLSFVDTSNMDQRVKVNLNITLHQIPCSAISLDLQDVTGAHLEDVRHTLHKLSLYQNGSFINENKAQKIQSLERYVSYPSNPVMKVYKKWKKQSQKQIIDCYGAQLYEGQKCITCQDVMLAYAARDWPQPPRESIAQCMSDRKVHINLENLQQQFNDLLYQHQDEILADISKQLKETEEEENRIEEFRQEQIAKFKAEGIELDLEPPKQDSTPLLKEVLSDTQKKQFKNTLLELSEMTHNPMQWSQERLKEEKMSTIDSLINILNISLDDYTSKLQYQIKFGEREIVVPERRLPKELAYLTRLSRQKCDQTNKVTVLIQTNDDQINHELNITIPKGLCEYHLNYSTQDINDDQFRLIIDFGPNDSIVWLIDKSIQSPMLKTLTINITNIDLQQIQRRSLIDLPSRLFKLSIYIPLSAVPLPEVSVLESNVQGRRLLYQEDFQVETAQSQYHVEDAYEIQEHLGEGCQVFGHLFIKKVPGNIHIGFGGKGSAARILSTQFSISHTLNLFEFTSENEELTLGTYLKATNPLDGKNSDNNVDQNSNYYIKLVSSIYESIWGNSQQIYTFTSYDQLSQSKQQLPSIIFRYEFDAITMRYRPKCGSVFQLIISLLAILGGTFAVSNLFSKILQSLGL